MPRFMTVTTWTPEQARALNMRYHELINGKSPKEVLNGFAKIKLITTEVSLPNRTSFMLYEYNDEDRVAVSAVSMYFQEVCTQVSHPVLTFEDYLKVRELLPPEKTHKPESPYK
jgi:hypothetical protein